MGTNRRNLAIISLLSSIFIINKYNSKGQFVPRQQVRSQGGGRSSLWASSPEYHPPRKKLKGYQKEAMRKKTYNKFQKHD